MPLIGLFIWWEDLTLLHGGTGIRRLRPNELYVDSDVRYTYVGSWVVTHLVRKMTSYFWLNFAMPTYSPLTIGPYIGHARLYYTKAGTESKLAVASNELVGMSKRSSLKSQLFLWNNNLTINSSTTPSHYPVFFRLLSTLTL